MADRRDEINPEKLIFIFGSARSGTTLIAKLLDASPEVLYRHEPDISFPSKEIPFLPTVPDYDKLHIPTQSYIGKLSSLRTSRTIGSPPYFSKEFRSSVGNMLWQANAYVAKIASRCGLEIPISDWINQKPPLVTVLKSVSSVARAPLIHNSIMNARVIHVVRHPCAVVASQLRGISNGRLPVSIPIESVLQMDEAKRYPIKPHEVRSLSNAGKIAFVWMVHNDKIYSELKLRPRYRLVIYEDICSNTIEKMKEIYIYCGLEWQVGVEYFIGKLESEMDKSHGYFSLKRNIKSGLYKWQEILSDTEKGEVTAIVRYSEVGQKFVSAPHPSITDAEAASCKRQPI